MINLYEEYGWHYVGTTNDFLLFEKPDDGKNMDIFSSKEDACDGGADHAHTHAPTARSAAVHAGDPRIPDLPVCKRPYRYRQ